MNLKVSTSDPGLCRAIANNPDFKSLQLYPSKSNGHKFKPGDIYTLAGLVDYPEHNGETVKILSIRQDGANGKAYYVEGEINRAVNWVYEYRLVAPKTAMSLCGVAKAASEGDKQP